MKKHLALWILAILFLWNYSSSAQCSISSSNGYIVNIRVVANSIIPSSNPCPNGYNYNLAMSYTVSYSGSNIPSNLYTLQSDIICNGNENHWYYNLPLTSPGGTGSGTTGQNVWRPQTDCATSTPASMNCNVLQIKIQGPGIPDQVVNCGTAVSTLPIELLSFNADILSTGNLIKWSTATEQDNSHFILERSADAFNWTTITQMDGAGNSTTVRHYSFLDKDPLRQINYYRLKQVDNTGENTTYIISVNNEVNQASTQVYASAINGQPGLDVKVYSLSSSSVHMQVLNSMGQIVKEADLRIQDNVFDENVLLPESGNVYFIILTQDNFLIGRHKVFVPGS